MTQVDTDLYLMNKAEEVGVYVWWKKVMCYTGCSIWPRTILRFSELARDIKVSFGYDVLILVDYTYEKMSPLSM
jgi:hypothetical protein